MVLLLLWELNASVSLTCNIDVCSYQKILIWFYWLYLCQCKKLCVCFLLECHSMLQQQSSSYFFEQWLYQFLFYLVLALHFRFRIIIYLNKIDKYFCDTESTYKDIRRYIAIRTSKRVVMLCSVSWEGRNTIKDLRLLCFLV